MTSDGPDLKAAASLVLARWKFQVFQAQMLTELPIYSETPYEFLQSQKRSTEKIS